MLQSSYTWSKSEDTTQASTFFSDATNGTTSAFPEFIPDYNKGLSDFHAAHNWVMNLSYDLPWGASLKRRGGGRCSAAGACLASSTCAAALRSPCLCRTIARDRSGSPRSVLASGETGRATPPGLTATARSPATPSAWFNPAAFVLQPAGTFGNTGRGDFIGPDLRTVDLSFVKDSAWSRLGNGGRMEVRIEVFNLFNRANFGPPQPDRVRRRRGRRATARELRTRAEHHHVGAADAVRRARPFLSGRGRARCRSRSRSRVGMLAALACGGLW